MEKIVYVDECGIDTCLYREYRYAARSRKVFGRISGRKYKRCGIVAAQMNGRILAPLQYDGTMDGSLFEFWFVGQLLPSLEKGCVIVMNNASFHCKTCLFSAAHEAGIDLVFLPPIPLNSTLLSTFGLGSNVSFVKPFLFTLLSMNPYLILFNFVNYTSVSVK